MTLKQNTLREIARVILTSDELCGRVRLWTKRKHEFLVDEIDMLISGACVQTSLATIVGTRGLIG